MGITNGSYATVSVFDLKSQILSLLTDPELTKTEYLAEGLDIFSGDVPEKSNTFGEIYAGEVWSTAVLHHRGNNTVVMPIGLVVFGNKSHFDLHGALATTPITFTLSIFD